MPLHQSAAILRFLGCQLCYYDTQDPFAMHFADAVIMTVDDVVGKGPSGPGFRMFAPEPIAEENLAQMVEHRRSLYT